jgi:hypothetical protein
MLPPQQQQQRAGHKMPDKIIISARLSPPPPPPPSFFGGGVEVLENNITDFSVFLPFVPKNNPVLLIQRNFFFGTNELAKGAKFLWRKKTLKWPYLDNKLDSGVGN